MNIIHIVQIVSPFLAVIGALGFGGKWARKNLPLILADLKKDAPIVQKDIQTIGADIGHALGWPGLEAVKAPLELQLHALGADLHKLHIARAAQAALGAFGGDLTALTSNEEGTAAQFVSSELAKVGITLDPKAILSALKDAQDVFDKLRAMPAYDNTKKLDASLQALKSASTDPAPAQTA